MTRSLAVCLEVEVRFFCNPRFVAFVAFGSCLSGAALAQQVSAPQGVADPVLAFNLADVKDWGSNMPFLDIARTMRPFIAGTDDQWETMGNDDLRAGGFLDEAGWPLRLPPKATIFRAGFDWSHDSGAAKSRAGRYLLTYDGAGRIALGGSAELVDRAPGRIVFDNADGAGFWLELVENDPQGTGENIRNIRIVREDRLPLYQAGAVFNPDWLAVIRDARHLRLMDWMETNDSEIVHWEDRPKLGDATWARVGVPLEIMVQLANETGTEPWFTLPHQADDEYVRHFATYVHEHLDPRLKVRVEFSNEVWNGAFDQSDWVDEQAKKVWHRDAGLYYHAKRATEMALIWEDVFGADSSSRLVNVLAGQAVNSWLTEELITAGGWREEEPDAYVPPEGVFEEFAVTSYFGDGVMGDPAVRGDLVARMNRSPEEAASWLTARLRDPAADDSIPARLAELAQQREVANKHGLKLTLYEGGQHVHHLFAIDGMSKAEAEKMNDFMQSYVRSDNMADLYEELWRGWQNVGQGPFMQYNAVSGASKWGSWGLYAYLGDRPPRAKVLEHLASAGGSWWGEGGGPQFLQGVTVTGESGDDVLAGTPEEDYLVGGAGDDRLIPGAGNDGLNGGPGTDTAEVDGTAADYRIRRAGEGFRMSGADGEKYLFSIERILFSDGSVVAPEELAHE